MNKVYILCGGGLGDILINYINDGSEKIPCTNLAAARWFRRLKDLKEKKNPLIQVLVYCHNYSAKDFLEPVPFIDEVKLMGWQKESISKEELEKVTDYLPINSVYKWEDYQSSRVKFYISEENKQILKEVKPKSRYVVIHPFARKSNREVAFNHYYAIIEKLAAKGIKSVIIGGSYKLSFSKNKKDEKMIEEEFPYQHKDMLNLVNKIHISLIPHLILGADGFIGTHSCWILLSAWAQKRMVSMFPDRIDRYKEGDLSWIEAKRKYDPYVWFFDAEFNKICLIKDEKTKIDYDSYANFLANG